MRFATVHQPHRLTTDRVVEMIAALASCRGRSRGVDAQEADATGYPLPSARVPGRRLAREPRGTHREHRAGSPADHVLGHAPHQDMPQPRPPMRGQDDQVTAQALGRP